MNDLITLDRARQSVPSAVNAEEPILATLITAASAAVRRYCRRDFNRADHDELIDGTGRPVLALRQYPVLAVASVRTDPTAVLAITNTSSANQQARVAVTASGVALTRVASGVATTTTVTFAGRPTLAELAAAIDALGHGWSVRVAAGFANHPSADLVPPQGSANAKNAAARLVLHVVELGDYRIHAERGWLVRDAGWVPGQGNYRVQYTAGHAVVPHDVQEAVAQLVASFFAERGRDQLKSSESSAGAYSYHVADSARWPRLVRLLLQPYRQLRA
jgi:hypothetical protein